MDWDSRKVLGWRLSNTDQGSQFTSEEWSGELTQLGIAISMDGKGRCRDNVFIERLWRRTEDWL
jgi:putative transposase